MTAYKSHLPVRRFLVFCLVILALFSGRMFASVQDHTMLVPANDSVSEKFQKPESNPGEKFNAGKMIMEHVLDNHEWHVATIGNLHLTIPLPVILLYDGKLYVFLSSRFHNETHSYQGFKLDPEGPHKDKIFREGANEHLAALWPIAATIM